MKSGYYCGIRVQFKSKEFDMWCAYHALWLLIHYALPSIDRSASRRMHASTSIEFVHEARDLHTELASER